MKRSDYTNWDEFFMGTAILAATRSKDPLTQVGACIVNKDKKIVGVGYNSFPFGISDDDKEYSWNTDKMNKDNNKDMYVVHAEANAIIGNSLSETEGCTIYVTLFPCNACAKLIIQSHIKKVIYLKHTKVGKKNWSSSKKMFDSVDIQYELFETNRTEPIKIDFDNNTSQRVNENSSTSSKKPKLDHS